MLQGIKFLQIDWDIIIFESALNAATMSVRIHKSNGTRHICINILVSVTLLISQSTPLSSASSPITFLSVYNGPCSSLGRIPL